MDNRLLSNSGLSTLTARSKRPFIILGVLLGCFIISTIVLAALFTREVINEASNDDTCLSPYCIKAANYIIDSIDQTVDPCENFYQFACGTWLKSTTIPFDENAQNIVRVLEKRLHGDIADLLSKPTPNETVKINCVDNARLLYGACINEEQIEADGVEPFLSLINNEFGGWPILQGASWNGTFNLPNLFLKLRQYDYNVIFRTHTNIDEKNSASTIIAVGQGVLGLPERQYFASESSITVAYRQFMRNLTVALMTDNDTSLIDSDIQAMFAFEQNIAQYYWTHDEQRLRYNQTVLTTVGALAPIFSTNFDFTNYLRAQYQLAGVVLADTDLVVVSELTFLQQVATIIAATPARVLQNYLVWHFMMDQASNMPNNIRSLRADFDRVFQGIALEERRITKCGVYVNNNMGFAVSKIYIQNFFDKNARSPTIDMVENVRSSFINILDQSSWLDDATKGTAKDKAQAIGHHVGYPDYLDSDDNTQLENAYIKYVFAPSHVQNVFKLHQLKSGENFQSLRNPVDLKAWRNPPTVVDAFYETSQNHMIFPAGILQMPYMNKDAPNYLNYGGIGTVIGHQITRAFDDIGHQFDKNGNRNPWFTEPTNDQFNNRKQCIIDQYNNFTIPQINMNGNGNQTQGQDISDNGGIKAAFFAYQKWAKANPSVDKILPGLSNYTNEQLFFINYAHTMCLKMTNAFAYNWLLQDVRSIDPFRVLGPTSNFDGFDKVFSCKPGQGNSRVNKCVVW